MVVAYHAARASSIGVPEGFGSCSCQVWVPGQHMEMISQDTSTADKDAQRALSLRSASIKWDSTHALRL